MNVNQHNPQNNINNPGGGVVNANLNGFHVQNPHNADVGLAAQNPPQPVAGKNIFSRACQWVTSKISQPAPAPIAVPPPNKEVIVSKLNLPGHIAQNADVTDFFEGLRLLGSEIAQMTPEQKAAYKTDLDRELFLGTGANTTPEQREVRLVTHLDTLRDHHWEIKSAAARYPEIADGFKFYAECVKEHATQFLGDGQVGFGQASYIRNEQGALSIDPNNHTQPTDNEKRILSYLNADVQNEDTRIPAKVVGNSARVPLTAEGKQFYALKTILTDPTATADQKKAAADKLYILMQGLGHKISDAYQAKKDVIKTNQELKETCKEAAKDFLQDLGLLSTDPHELYQANKEFIEFSHLILGKKDPNGRVTQAPLFTAEKTKDPYFFHLYHNALYANHTPILVNRPPQPQADIREDIEHIDLNANPEEFFAQAADAQNNSDALRKLLEAAKEFANGLAGLIDSLKNQNPNFDETPLNNIFAQIDNSALTKPAVLKGLLKAAENFDGGAKELVSMLKAYNPNIDENAVLADLEAGAKNEQKINDLEQHELFLGHQRELHRQANVNANILVAKDVAEEWLQLINGRNDAEIPQEENKLENNFPAHGQHFSNNIIIINNESDLEQENAKDVFELPVIETTPLGMPNKAELKEKQIALVRTIDIKPATPEQQSFLDRITSGKTKLRHVDASSIDKITEEQEINALTEIRKSRALTKGESDRLTKLEMEKKMKEQESIIRAREQANVQNAVQGDIQDEEWEA